MRRSEKFNMTAHSPKKSFAITRLVVIQLADLIAFLKIASVSRSLRLKVTRSLGH